MKDVVVTTRIPDALGATLDALANDLDRPRSWVVAKAIERYVAEESELIAAIRVGEADLEAGRTQTQAEVETMFGVKRDRRNAA